MKGARTSNYKSFQIASEFCMFTHYNEALRERVVGTTWCICVDGVRFCVGFRVFFGVTVSLFILEATNFYIYSPNLPCLSDSTVITGVMTPGVAHLQRQNPKLHQISQLANVWRHIHDWYGSPVKESNHTIQHPRKTARSLQAFSTRWVVAYMSEFPIYFW